LRKAINALFFKAQTRGTFLVYAKAHNALKMNNDSVLIFVNAWLPGLISNYKQVSLSVAINKFYESIINPYLSRTQLTAIKDVKMRPFLKSTAYFKKEDFLVYLNYQQSPSVCSTTLSG